MLYDNDTFEHQGHTFRVNFPADEFADAPWENEDGHGPVTNWTRRAKKPGERVLHSHHGSCRFYDFAEAVRIAKRDGWSTKEVQERVAKGERVTNGERAHLAAEADFKRLKAWCNDEWCYVDIVVTLLDERGCNTSFEAVCGGFESDCHEYLEEQAEELASWIIAELYADTKWHTPSCVEV